MSNVRGARFVNSHDMQMPRYSSYRDTVGTEYISFLLAITVEVNVSKCYTYCYNVDIISNSINATAVAASITNTTAVYMRRCGGKHGCHVLLKKNVE